ncbi:MAG TPA: hypothetical protein VNA28_07400 [Solirubrobacteraceae bacterium]|nr:hypothetical protein [Solirubrobacteraceae bacterium]
MPEAIDELLKRRRLGGAALVLAGLVVAAIVLRPVLTDDDPPPPQRVAPAGRIVVIPRLGLAFAHPRSWTRNIQGRVIRLRSPEGAAVMTFASVGGRRPKQTKALLLKTLRARLKPAIVARDGPGRLGPRPATTFELIGLTPGTRERALALVADTEYRTYAVTVLTPARPSRRRLLEATQILASVRLTRPQGR